MPWSTLFDLLVVFTEASLLALGGGTAVLAEIQRNTVGQYHWMTNQQFINVFAITQATPGPSMLYVSLIGYYAMAQHYPHSPWMAFSVGMVGMLISTTATLLPSSLLAYFVGRWWEHFHGSSWRDPVEKGLSAVTVGLLFASGVIVSQDASTGLGWPSWVLIAVSAVLFGFTKVSPLLVMGIGGAMGYMHWLGPVTPPVQ